MCGNNCKCQSKLLVAINIVYLLIGVFIILLGFLGNNSNSTIADLPILPGLFACGVFLLLLSIIGFVAACKPRRTLQLCYIIFIAITVIIQVSISIACLAVQEDREERIIQEAWDYCEGSNLQYIHDSEAVFRCCGYDELDQRRNFSNKERFYQFERGYCIDIVEDCGNTSTINDIENDKLMVSKSMENNIVTTVSTFTTVPQKKFLCPPCKTELDKQAHRIFKIHGAIGLVFAIVEFLPMFVAYKQWKYTIQHEDGMVTLR